MEPPCRLVAAEQGGKYMQLGWFVDSQPGEQGASAHENDTRVSDLLCSIEFALW